MSQPPSRHERSGFSLIEMLVVLAILAILVSVGVYTMGSRSSVAVRGLTQNIASSLADAQQLARATGHPVTLHVKGTTPTTLLIDFEYQAEDPANPPALITVRGGGFSMASIGNSSNYAVPGIQTTQVAATAMDTTGLQALGLVADWGAFFVNGSALFQGADTQTFTFASNGELNRDCFVTVAPPVAGSNSPVGVVVATRRNGIHAYYFSGVTGATWRSL